MSKKRVIINKFSMDVSGRRNAKRVKNKNLRRKRGKK